MSYFLYIVAGEAATIQQKEKCYMTIERLLLEVEKEALKLAFNKGGSWERYNQLKAEADTALEQWIKDYDEKNFS